jgi:hypothetical protein
MPAAIASPTLVEEITRGLDQPEALERLFRQNPADFPAAFTAVASRAPESLLVRAWQARLAAESASAAAWVAIPSRDLALIAILSIAATFVYRSPFVADVRHAVTALLLTLPLAIYLGLRREIGTRLWIVSLASIAIAGLQSCLLATNRLPTQNSDATWLALIHLGVAHVQLLLIPFAGATWRAASSRIAFLRYLGEVLVLSGALLLGGVVLTFLTVQLFDALRINILRWYVQNVVAWGILAAPLVATYIERTSGTRIASRVAMPFVPLLLITLVVYLPFALSTSAGASREVLVVFNAMLVVVAGAVVFFVCDRGRREPSGLFDLLSVALLVVCLAIDVIALFTVVGRFLTIGFWTSHAIVIGTNVVLLVFLCGLLLEYRRFVRHEVPLERVEAWIARYMPVFMAWALFVGFVVPFYPSAPGLAP